MAISGLHRCGIVLLLLLGCASPRDQVVGTVDPAVLDGGAPAPTTSQKGDEGPSVPATEDAARGDTATVDLSARDDDDRPDVGATDPDGPHPSRADASPDAAAPPPAPAPPPASAPT